MLSREAAVVAKTRIRHLRFVQMQVCKTPRKARVSVFRCIRAVAKIQNRQP